MNSSEAGGRSKSLLGSHSTRVESSWTPESEVRSSEGNEMNDLHLHS